MEVITSRAAEINRLHTETLRLAGESRRMLTGALIAAWQAGRLLLEEKKQVSQIDRGAWGQWLDLQFDGSRRTAQRYMKLARLVPELSGMHDASLRQAYARLGIATEPKTLAQSRPLPPLPDYILPANRLLRALKKRGLSMRIFTPNEAGIRSDLKEVYELLRPIFESQAK